MRLDLAQAAGLPLFLEDGKRLVFGAGVEGVEPSVRRLEDVRGVLMEPECDGPPELYYMYRGVAMSEHREMATEHGIRYDITVILAGKLGKEYIKTAGHYHPLVPGTGVSYPELYQVIAGRAHCILQKPGDSAGNVSRVIVVEAGGGDLVLVPPGYGHVTVNPDPGTLVMANLVEHSFRSVYGPIREMRGACIYEIEEEGGGRLVVNSSYSDVPEPSWAAPLNPSVIGLEEGSTIYGAFVDAPEDFQYLVRPQEFPELWETVYRGWLRDQAHR